MKRFSFVLGVLAFLPYMQIIKAQSDHLEPVGGIFAIYDFEFEYYSSVRTILCNTLSDNPEIRILIIPSFNSGKTVHV